jgi:hypothetical protein
VGRVSVRGARPGRRRNPLEPLESIAMPLQVCTISKRRLLARLGSLADAGLRRADEDRLLLHLGIDVDEAEPDDEA